ncbi:hypothetical protein [Algibacter lectus]|uniref:hypothetical protein n=1 Tax=Algibacter lectus TaxID=221126 RepID=UPI002494F795|nr:hypothetical protein [Algibacter lectus]
MSYTKLNKEIEKYYKSNNKSFGYNALKTNKDEQKKILNEYNRVRDIIVEKWKKEKRIKELISCAQGGWFPYVEFTKPLEEYFIEQNDLLSLKVLCEKEIRFKIEDTLKCVKNVKENFPKVTIDEILSYNLEEYLKTKSYHPIGELSRWRNKALLLLNRYIELLKQTNEIEYLKMIEDLKEKTEKLTIKKSELKHIKHKLK